VNKFTKTKESATRKKIDRILENLGWDIDEESPDCNVFTERAKTTEQNKKFKGKRPDYVLYKSHTDDPIAIIETKKTSVKNLKNALTQAIEFYAKPLGINIIFVTDGTIVETFDRRNGENLYHDDQLITEFLSEKKLLKFLEQGSKLYTSEKFAPTKRELIEIFAEANEPLRKEGISEGIERFTEFSNLLFLKLISEIENDREENGQKRKLEKKYCWETFYQLESETMLGYINGTVLPYLVDKYNHSGDVFESKLKIANPDTLKSIVDKLSPLKLLDADSDIKGDAFEYFLKNSVSVGTDLGEYFTPRHIVKLMVELVNPKFGDRIYDPACGTGGFLIEAFKHIKLKCRQTKENLVILENETVYGRELTATAKIAKMNMIIFGDGHTNIKRLDSLKNPVKNEYEAILTNFPFSQTTDYSQLYGFTSQDANPVFLKHAIDALTKDGTAGIVVPDGLLFDKNLEYVKLRKLLLETCNVIAVIQLHTFVFKPYTGQPTSILIFKKGKQTKKVWFFDVLEDGFKQTGSKKGRPPIKENDLKLLREIWVDKLDSEKSFSVDFNSIKNKNYKLTMNTYKIRRKRTVPIKRLDEICNWDIGGTPPRNDRICWIDGNHLWVKITDMNKMYIDDTEEKITDEGIKKSSVVLLNEGTLLFSFKLTIGKVAITKKSLYTNEAVAGLTLKTEYKNDKYLIKYLYYILPTIDYTPFAQRATKGFTLNKETIGDIVVPFPEYEIRKKLVIELDEKEKQKKQLFYEIETINKNQKLFVKENTD